jgi:GNS1/SUR4 family
MIVGVIVTIVGCYLVWFDPVSRSLRNTENYCRLNSKNVSGGVILYGSYLALFLEFFIERYFRNKSQKKKNIPSSSKANYIEGNSEFVSMNGKNATEQMMVSVKKLD